MARPGPVLGDPLVVTPEVGVVPGDVEASELVSELAVGSAPVTGGEVTTSATGSAELDPPGSDTVPSIADTTLAPQHITRQAPTTVATIAPVRDEEDDEGFPARGGCGPPNECGPVGEWSWSAAKNGGGGRGPVGRE